MEEQGETLDKEESCEQSGEEDSEDEVNYRINRTILIISLPHDIIILLFGNA